MVRWPWGEQGRIQLGGFGKCGPRFRRSCLGGFWSVCHVEKRVIDGVLKTRAGLVKPLHAFRNNLTNFVTRASVLQGAIDIF